jgi:pimeloyl-ACP methyl ester carboxylesterase
MSTWEHDGLYFHYVDEGEGLPFIFQHGLGGELSSPREVYAPRSGVRFLSFDFRAHGETRPLGDEDKISFASFADDIRAFMDSHHIDQAVIGGISMGAGVALHFALRYPERVRALLLSRPAWVDAPLPENLRMFVEIARLIRQYGAAEALEHFRQSETYRRLLAEAPDVAASAEGQFLQPRAEEVVARLERIPNDVPSHDRMTWSTIHVPTLVLANHIDPVHPYEMAKTIAEAIPGAQMRELTSKSVNKPEHIRQAQEYIGAFLDSVMNSTPEG